ncbi:hypothetical protein D3C77_584000 [compost metagenome]
MLLNGPAKRTRTVSWIEALCSEELLRFICQDEVHIELLQSFTQFFGHQGYNFADMRFLQGMEDDDFIDPV